MVVIAYGIGLALIWVLAWGTPTPANILSGLAVAAVLLVVVPDIRPGSWPAVRVRPIAVLRLVGYVLGQAVTANVQMTRAILRRDTHITTAVVALPLPASTDGLVTLVSNAMAMTPGTIPVEVGRDPTVLYVHALLLDDLEQVRHKIAHLATLSYRAFGSDEAIAALAAAQPQEATS